MGGFNAMHALSEMTIQQQLQTNGQRQRWICFGRSAGALILEEYEHAIARGQLFTAKLVVEVCLLMLIILAPHPDGLGAKM
jgi:3-oxoacyl-(acyl-carrier-protein) synthase